MIAARGGATALWTRHLPLAAWTVASTAMLLVPSASMGGAREPAEALEEIAHATVIGVLALLACRSLAVVATRARSAVAGGTAAVAYAILMEALQELVPGRGWETLDLVTSVLGAAVAAALFLLAPRRRPAREAPRGGV